MSSVEVELQKVSGVKPKGKKEDRAKYLSRLLKGAEAVFNPPEDAPDKKQKEADTAWENISEDAQAWYNTALKADSAGKALADFPSAEKEEPKKKGKAEAKEEEEETEEEEEEEEEEEDTVQKIKKGEEPDEEEEEEAEEEPEAKSKKGKKAMPTGNNLKKKAKVDAAKAKASAKAEAAEKKTNGKKGSKKAEAKSTGRKGKYGASQKITIVAEENPRRSGHPAHKNWAVYKNGITVSAYLEKGGSRRFMRQDARRKHIKIS